MKLMGVEKAASKKQRHVLYMALCCVWKPVTSGLFGGDKMQLFADWDEWLQALWHKSATAVPLLAPSPPERLARRV